MDKILITNDDGLFAPGINALADILKDSYNLTIVAPDRERSAASHSLTLQNPLRIVPIDAHRYAVDGTPTDCVILAMHSVLHMTVDLVISGINNGPNMGEDVLYSGTVAAAIEAMNLGFPAIAVSLGSYEKGNFNDAAIILKKLLEQGCGALASPNTILNINIPPLPIQDIKGVQITKLGHRKYRDIVVEKTDPRGRPYYWIGGEKPQWEATEHTDFFAVDQGFVSITPITVDMTKYASIPSIKKWASHISW